MEVVSAHGRARDRREAESAQVVERARNTRAAGEQRKTRDRQHKRREKNGGRDRESPRGKSRRVNNGPFLASV
jgi:hypothetical protein